MQDSIAKLQADRKHRTDQLPSHDWDTKRKALIESGMVEDAHDRRIAHCKENGINPDDVVMWKC